MTAPNNPFINYDTDQFTDPTTGYTVYDDGSDIYVQPFTGQVYFKIRTFNGMYTAIGGGNWISYKITLSLTPPGTNGLVMEDGVTFLVAEDGMTILVAE